MATDCRRHQAEVVRSTAWAIARNADARAAQSIEGILTVISPRLRIVTFQKMMLHEDRGV